MAVIFHMDLDAFFISVERILNPQLQGKPVIVGGDPHGRGVVAACSYEARAFGIHSAMPIRQAYKLCPQGIYLHGHMEEYSRFSRLVAEIVRKYAPVVEQASIDEFYMDLTGCVKNGRDCMDLASRLQKEIGKHLLLPCSIGIASNKTLAKIASDFKKPRGITYILPGKEREFLAPLPVGIIPGIGKVSEEQLKKRGIDRIRDIQNIPADYYTSTFGKTGLDFWKKANGEGSTFISVHGEQKSISRETTFDDFILEPEVLKNVLLKLTGKVCQTLREQGVKASTVHLKLRYSDFQTLTRAKTIVPTDDDSDVYNTVCSLLDKAFTRRVSIRLIGVSLTNFTQSADQLLLFDSRYQKKKDMLKAINNIRGKYGYSKISYGAG
ncbi:MAG: DNA polymerase IV [Ignavibacteria bacterium]|nr:DNA polymerase IV [Ignavibacteria bacterium]